MNEQLKELIQNMYKKGFRLIIAGRDDGRFKASYFKKIDFNDTVIGQTPSFSDIDPIVAIERATKCALEGPPKVK